MTKRRKTMRFKSGILTAIAVSIAYWGAQAMADDQPLRFQVDKGTLVLKYEDLDKDYDVSYTLPQSCRARLSISTDKDNVVRLNHSQEPCQSGATIELTVNKVKSARVVLEAGHLTVVRPQATLAFLTEFKAQADAGTIATNVPGLVPERINTFAGARVIYRDLKRQDKPVVDVRVVAGSIQI
jgi:hypothetical protein